MHFLKTRCFQLRQFNRQHVGAVKCGTFFFLVGWSTCCTFCKFLVGAFRILVDALLPFSPPRLRAVAVVSHQPCKFVTCWCNRICELVRLFVQASEGVGGGCFLHKVGRLKLVLTVNGRTIVTLGRICTSLSWLFLCRFCVGLPIGVRTLVFQQLVYCTSFLRLSF